MAWENVTKNSGQALVESVVALSLTLSGLAFTGFGLWALMLKHWCDHHSYELGICLMTESPTKICKQHFINQLHILSANTPIELKIIQHGFHSAQLKGSWYIYKKWVIQFAHHIELETPL